jgi:hypothetical protein
VRFEITLIYSDQSEVIPLLSKEGSLRQKAQTGVVCSKTREAAPYRCPREARSFLSHARQFLSNRTTLTTAITGVIDSANDAITNI